MEQKLKGDISRVILTKEQLAEKVSGAAAWLDRRLAGSYPIAVCVLKGSVMFYCDLIRAMKTAVQLDFITASSYGSATTGGELRIVADLTSNVAGRDVIIVEDIVDTGRTIAKLKNLIVSRGAKSVTLVSLLDKPSRREVAIKPDYSCMTVGDEFVVGYGLDYAQKYRDLDFVGVLKREVYEKSF